MEGSIYTVDDVSDLLGIPRPTLYRYLREYSIPHLRQGGRIRIPEDSFDRIREARDLHKEGLGTETVRRQLREGGGPDTGELDRRLNKLHDTLENLRGDLRAKPATGEVALSPALQTILARQSLMLSAMFNLTGMVEDLLLLKSGKGRKRPVARVEEGLIHTVPLRAEERGQLPGTLVAEPVAVREAEAPVIPSPTRNLPASRFGTLGRRRRRAALAVLSALLLGLLLILLLPMLNDGESATSNAPARNDAAGQQRPPEERPAGAGADEADGGEGAGNPDNVATTDAAPPEAETTTAEESTQDTETPPDANSGGIPDVSGRPLEEAARALSEAGYTVAAIRSVQSPDEYGTVTGTEPAAGTETRPNAPVVITMSAGPTGASPASASSASGSSASASSASSASASSASASAPSTSTSSASASAGASASASPSP
jgi:excisionase family DNA binding protein